MASIYNANDDDYPTGTYPPLYEPYLREKGDFAFDGGIPLGDGRISTSYHDELQNALFEYSESLEYVFLLVLILMAFFFFKLNFAFKCVIIFSRKF